MADEKNAEKAAGKREERTLREELLNEAAAAGTERSADGEFAAARFGTRLQKIGDIGASDEQNEEDGDEERIHGLFSEAEDRVVQGLHFFADAFVRFGTLLLDAPGDDIHFGLCLRKRDAWLHPRDGHEPVILAGGIAWTGGVFRFPEVDGLTVEIVEACRHDSDDGAEDSQTVNGERLADGVRVAVVMSFPKRVADDNSLRELLHFFGGENSAKEGLGAEQREIVGSDVGEADGFLTARTGDDGGFGGS